MVRKGFTLVELLIVIGIIAILAAAVVLTLNPAELLRQGRDSTRISDLATLRSALALYITDQSGASSYGIGAHASCYFPATTAAVECDNRFGTGVAGSGGTETEGTSQSPAGTGWITVDFTDISSGSPLSVLPVDPVQNSDTYFYAYRPGPSACTGLTCTVYELNANMESTKFASTGTGDVETTDGGDTVTGSTLYEVGTDPGLDL